MDIGSFGHGEGEPDDGVGGGTGGDTGSGEGGDPDSGTIPTPELGGDDVLTGGAGNDILVGGVGNDTLEGGPDQMTLPNFFLGGDAVVEAIEFETGGQTTSHQIYGALREVRALIWFRVSTATTSWMGRRETTVLKAVTSTIACGVALVPIH